MSKHIVLLLNLWRIKFISNYKETKHQVNRLRYISQSLENISAPNDKSLKLEQLFQNVLHLGSCNLIMGAERVSLPGFSGQRELFGI